MRVLLPVRRTGRTHAGVRIYCRRSESEAREVPCPMQAVEKDGTARAFLGGQDSQRLPRRCDEANGRRRAGRVLCRRVPWEGREASRRMWSSGRWRGDRGEDGVDDGSPPSPASSSPPLGSFPLPHQQTCYGLTQVRSGFGGQSSQENFFGGHMGMVIGMS